MKIATDGSALGNPGPGGWAWVRADGTAYGKGRAQGKTTNNAMELQAVRAALMAYSEADVDIVTDSKYVIQCVTVWAVGWKRRGWKTAEGKPVANQQLIEDIVELCRYRQVNFTWVRGHSGHAANEYADALARQAAQGR